MRFIIHLVYGTITGMERHTLDGTSKVIGGIGNGFVSGMRVSFIALTLMLAIAGVFSFVRGAENRHEPIQTAAEENRGSIE